MNEVIHHISQDAPTLIITPAGTAHIHAWLAKHKENAGIRLSVKKTGCSGLSYVIDMVASAQEGDIIVPISETYLVCIDKASYPYLKGLTIDYVKQGLNNKFIFINPNQTGQCGCGESFTVEAR